MKATFLDGAPFYFVFLLFRGCKSVLFKACPPLLLGVLPLLVRYMHSSPSPLKNWWCRLYMLFVLSLVFFLRFRSDNFHGIFWAYVQVSDDGTSNLKVCPCPHWFVFCCCDWYQAKYSWRRRWRHRKSWQSRRSAWTPSERTSLSRPSRRLKSSRSCTTRTSSISKRSSSPGPERDEQGMQSMILNKNTIESFALLLIQMCHMLWCWVVKGNKYKGSICLWHWRVMIG